MASTVPGIELSPASPNETKAQVQYNSGSTTTSKITNGTVPRRKGNETRRKFPFPFKKEFSPLMRRRNQRPNKKHSSTEDVANSVNRDSLMEDGSVSDSNEEEEGT